jgi:hypothetical protein
MKKSQTAQDAVRLVPPVVPKSLSGFGFAPNLLLDFPVREQVFVAAPWALPGTFYRIRTTLMEHLDDEMAMETHSRMTENKFPFCRLGRNCHYDNPLRKFRALCPQATAPAKFAIL